MVAIREQFAAFGQGVKNAANAAGNAVADAARFTGSVITSPKTQQRVESGFRSGIDTAYTAMADGITKAVSKMENEGTTAINAPIKGMSELNIRRLDINEDMSSNSKTLRKVANGLIGYHEGVIKTSEKVSRAIGGNIHSIVRLILTPIRFVAKILNIEPVGALIQNSIALAVGFVFRGVTLAAMQLGHAAPYLAAAIVAAGVVAGFVFLAKISPLAAVGVGGLLLFMAQQGMINNLSGKVHGLTKELRDQKASTFQNRAKEAANNVADKARLAVNTAVKHKGAIATAAATAAAALGAYYYGGQAVELATPYARATADYISNSKAGEFVAPYATAAAGLASSSFEAVKGKIVDLFGTAATAPMSTKLTLEEELSGMTPAGISTPDFVLAS